MGALRAVPPSESTAELSIAAAAESGDDRALLIALRARVAKACDDLDTPQRDLAALTRRLLEIAKDIKALDAAENGDDVGAAAGTPDEEWPAS